MTPVVLCYHAVSPTWEHRLSLSPQLLLRQVEALRRFRPVQVTFDDAFRSAASVFPSLLRLGLPVRIFVCSGFAGAGAPLAIPELEGDDERELATMTWEELRGHVEEGVSIGSHTITHAHLTRLSDGELGRELRSSKAEIEDELGGPCPDLAYPYGEHDERVRRAVRAAGYHRAYALWGGQTKDPYRLRRLDLYRRHTPARAVVMATPLHRFAA